MVEGEAGRGCDCCGQTVTVAHVWKESAPDIVSCARNETAMDSPSNGFYVSPAAEVMDNQTVVSIAAVTSEHVRARRRHIPAEASFTTPQQRVLSAL